MRPRIIGRALGIGVRVAGRLAGQRIAGTPQSRPAMASTAASAAKPAIQSQAPAKAAGRIAAQAGRGVVQGAGGFLRPFRRVGGIVWLEVTGTFFLLFAFLFALRLWQTWRTAAGIGRDFAVVAAVVFLYLGVSSFWRARRR
jgi:hypothetical protein